MDNDQSECIIKNIKIKLSDYRHFFFQHTFKYQPVRKITFFIIMFAIFLLVLFFSMRYNMNFLFYVSMIVIALFSFSFLIILILSFQINKNFTSNKLLQDELNYTINNEYFEVHSINTNSKLTWDKIYKVAESKHLFAIYISKAQAFLLPKHHLNTDQYNTIKNIIKNALPEKKLAIKK